jgi:hypothetical protein
LAEYSFIVKAPRGWQIPHYQARAKKRGDSPTGPAATQTVTVRQHEPSSIGNTFAPCPVGPDQDNGATVKLRKAPDLRQLRTQMP